MILTFLFLILTYYILTQSELSLYYAFHGFTLWYSKMIPSLLPFMILSGILVRMDLSKQFAGILHPLLKRLYDCNKNVSYGIMIGFLCGFPMGARTSAELLKNGRISQREAAFLLAFCNNIGPVYFCSFVLPLLGLHRPVPYLFGMYGIPLLYGMVLRRTVFRDLNDPALQPDADSMDKHAESKHSLLDAVDKSIQASLHSILMLCGYMIFFNLLNILPHFWLPALHDYIAPILEITGGLSMLGDKRPFFSLCILTFGGLSCIAQTNSMIADSGLSLRQYLIHKTVLTIITVLYYFLCFLLV